MGQAVEIYVTGLNESTEYNVSLDITSGSTVVNNEPFTIKTLDPGYDQATMPVVTGFVVTNPAGTNDVQIDWEIEDNGAVVNEINIYDETGM